jgi:D-alanyl-D-alanine carboxypeptidase (penicillin-binding protein 5/6)
MIPWAVSAEDISPEAIVTSAEPIKEESLQTSTNAAIAMTVDAKSAVLIDADSGTGLFEQNSHDKLPPASVTKIMTMLLILEAVDRGQLTVKDSLPLF